MLGVSPQRVDQLAKSDDFPEPIAILAVGPIWTRASMEAWAPSIRPLKSQPDPHPLS
jgi:hypothetical protein